MVRSLVCNLKLIACVLACACALLATHATQAHALEVYSDGGIGTTYTSYFQDILDKYPVTQDYVYFRSGQYQYYLCVGDFELEGSVFTGEEYDYYMITTSSTYGTNYLTLNSGKSTGLSLDVSDHLVYSNLGHFPSLIERGDLYGYATTFVLVVIGCCALVRPLFGFVYRLR